MKFSFRVSEGDLLCKVTLVSRESTSTRRLPRPDGPGRGMLRGTIKYRRMGKLIIGSCVMGTRKGR